MKVLFIVNPRSGRGAGLATWRRISRLLAGPVGAAGSTRAAGSVSADAVVPGSPAETEAAAREAVRSGFERVVVVGGDGTLAAVAAQLIGTDTALGVIPAGTGNDFCRNMGLPRRPEAALATALGPQVRRIDVGWAAGDRCFLNAAGIGFDAEAAAAAGAFPALFGGTLPYLLGAFRTLSRYQPIWADITVDEHRFSGPIAVVAVANGRCYAGGMRIAPHAHPTDGYLDVCIGADLGRMELLDLMRRVYTGGHVGHPKVRMLRGRSVQMRIRGSVRAHLDGDPFEWPVLSFGVRPGALLVAASNRLTV